MVLSFPKNVNVCACVLARQLMSHVQCAIAQKCELFFYCCQKGVELSRKASIVLYFPWPDLFGTSYIVPPCKLLSWNTCERVDVVLYQKREANLSQCLL